MLPSLEQIVKESLEANQASFVQLVEEARQLICKEGGTIGNLVISGRLVTLKPQGKALVIGDIHGDLESLIHILKDSDSLKNMRQDKDAVTIFLGDYGDRGEFSVEVYYVVLKLKLSFPEQVILMRGNHEGPEDLMASPHDLPLQFQAKFGEKRETGYSELRELFACLYTAVLVKERYLMIHGGLPQHAKTTEDLAYAHAKHPEQDLLEDMLWSDPNPAIKGTQLSFRGAGKLFGEDVTADLLERFHVKILIRGHEPCDEGFKIDHNGRILTLFSRKGSPYFNAHGAYLQLPLSERLKSAEQLAKYVHTF